jgi:hypothetical protein
VIGYGAALAAVMGAFDYTGGSLFGNKRNIEEDKFERLNTLRTRYRTPGEETIAELGEGRGSFTLLFLFGSIDIRTNSNHLLQESMHLATPSVVERESSKLMELMYQLILRLHRDLVASISCKLNFYLPHYLCLQLLEKGVLSTGVIV